MKKHIISTLLMAGLALAGVSAHAEAADTTTNTSTAASAALPVPLQLAIQGGLKVEKNFQAAGGLKGWVLSEGPGRNMVVYTTEDGEVAIAGTMLDAKGQNLTAKYIEQYAPKVDYSKAWPRLESSAYIAEGAKGKAVKSVIYAFEDANCGYCHLAWKALQPYEKAGLQVRWIPVAFLGKDSANKAAAVMTAKDPAVAMAEMHANYGKQSDANTTPVSPEIKAKLDANAKLMNELGFRGTPAILYKDKTGKVVAQDGMPKPNMLPVITGLPAQPAAE